jgi:phage gp46-like protein
MHDIRIVSTFNWMNTVADWLLLPTGSLDETETLANVAKVALMTDAAALATEVLPDPDSRDRRGWWGDLDAQAIWNGWPIGCKEWLLTRNPILSSDAWEGDTTVRAQQYAQIALSPMISLGMVTSIDVVAARVDVDRIDVAVTLWRGPKDSIQLQFQDLWRQMLMGQ